MDYNDIQKRIERVYSALGARFDYDIEKRVKVERNESNGRVEIKMSISETNEADAINKVMAIIENLAKLKDHLKNVIEKNGGNKQVIEDEINNSPELQVLIDLDNSDKHGYPLKRPERSNKSPKILNIQNALQVTTEPKVGSLAGVSINLNDGGMQIHGAEKKIVIMADIVDKNGNHLYYLDKFVNEVLSQWEVIMKKYNCI